MNKYLDAPCMLQADTCSPDAHLPPDAGEDEAAPGSSPDGTTPQPPDDRSDEVERQTPAPEDESADPVGDGHSDADLAERLPATPD